VLDVELKIKAYSRAFIWIEVSLNPIPSSVDPRTTSFYFTEFLCIESNSFK